MGNGLSESLTNVPSPVAGCGTGEAGVTAGEFLRNVSTGLHELSQPITVLLCLVEYGSKLEASEELKQVMGWSADAVERLRVTVIAMQSMVRDERQRKNG